MILEQSYLGIHQTDCHQMFGVGSLRYLIVNCRSDPISSMAQRTLSWQPSFGSKWTKSADLFSCV